MVAFAVLVALLGMSSALAIPINVTNCPTAQQLIASAEGYRACTYVDTTGHKTICYGFNLDASGAEQKIVAVGGNWDSVYNHGGCLTSQQCIILLNGAVQSAGASELAIFGRQCTCIDAVLTDMTYNLGAAGMARYASHQKTCSFLHHLICVSYPSAFTSLSDTSKRTNGPRLRRMSRTPSGAARLARDAHVMPASLLLDVETAAACHTLQNGISFFNFNFCSNKRLSLCKHKYKK